MTRGIYKPKGCNLYWLRYAGLDGKIRRESSGTSDFKEAQGLLLDKKQDIKKGKEPETRKPIPNVTFNEFSVDYLKWAERQRGYVQKECVVNKLKNIFGGFTLRGISSKIVEQYQSEMLQAEYKPATINRHLATIKHMFTKAVEWEMAEDEALKRVRRVKLLPENNRRLRYLSREECWALINACEKLAKKNLHYAHLKPIVVTALYTGLRRGNILSLQWDNVDLKHGFILLDRTKSGDRLEVPINETLRKTLLELPRRLDGGYLFYDTITGKPYQDIKNSFHAICKEAKIKDFHFHDLRHTFASHLVMAGVDLTTIKELLGHKDIKMTLRYAHLAPAHKTRAVDMLDAVLGGGDEVDRVQEK